MSLPQQSSSRVPVTEPGWFVALAVSVFCGLGLLTLMQHELWRDELHGWVLASQSGSLSELFSHLRYESHTALWYLCLYLLSHVGYTPFAMQIFHFGLATLGIVLFVRFSPFSKVQKLCFVIGYFPLFEYGVISRTYVLGTVSLFAFCVLHARNRSGSIAQAALLVLLANTSIYGAMIALAFGLYLLIPWKDANKTGRTGARQPIYLLMIAAGIVACILQLWPPPDISPMVLKWHTEPERQRIETILSTVWQSYVPIPIPQFHFWETNILEVLEPFFVGPYKIWPSSVVTAISIGLIAVGAWMLARTPAFLFVYLLTTTEILAFSYFKHYGGLRHGGHLYLILVSCLWLAACCSPRIVSALRTSQYRPFPGRPVCAGVLTALFVLQAFAGAWAVQADVRLPFSASKDVADYIKKTGMDDLTIIGSEYYAAFAVAAHLHRAIYFAETDRVGTFVVWKGGRHHPTVAELIQKARDFAVRDRRDILLLMNYDLGPAARHLKIRTFDRSIVPGECYAIYRFPYNPESFAVSPTHEPLALQSHRDESESSRPAICKTK